MLKNLGKTSTECEGGKHSLLTLKKSKEGKRDVFIKKREKREKCEKRGKRGRPSKKISTECKMNTIRTLKVLGYCCGGCGGMITDGDIIEGKKTMVICIRCHKRQRITQLVTKEQSRNVGLSKKEYLEDTVQVNIERDIEAYVTPLPDEFSVVELDEEDVY